MKDYTLLKDAYFGTGGFANGSYITQHKRESAADYGARKKNAYYLNYFAPIINALVDPIFKKNPLRDYEGGASLLVEEFLKDVDGDGTGIGAFMKRAALMAKIYGVSFIVLDNAADAGEERNLAGVIEARKFPYAYLVLPEQITDYAIDAQGKLSMIEYRESLHTQNGYITYRSTKFTQKNWSVRSDTEPQKEGTHALGIVPVVPLLSRILETNTIFPSPEFLSIAGVAKEIYNACSWLDEILRKQTFPILTIPSLDMNDLSIGTHNALGYSSDSSHMPDFIAPPSEPAAILQKQIANLIEEMYRMASLSFLTTSAQQISGISRQWEFERTNQQLSNFAFQCAQAEQRVMQIFSRWTGLELSYSVTYPEDFGIVDTKEEIETAQAVLDLGFCKEMKIEVLKKTLAAYVPNLPDARFDEILQSTEQEAEAQEREDNT